MPSIRRLVLFSALVAAGSLLAFCAGPKAGLPDPDEDESPTGRPLPPRVGRALPNPSGCRVPGTGAYQREWWYWHQRSMPGGIFPPHAEFAARSRAAAFRARRRSSRVPMRFAAALQAGQWRELGPRGVEQGYGPGIVAGRITSILLQPETGRILVGAASGGIWKRSLAAGAVFEPKSDAAPSLSIGCLAADPSHPDVVYAGTGEAGVSVDSFSGAGILKSVDGGETWNRIDNGVFTSAKISQIWVDPRRSERLLASQLFQGLFESNDGGVSWTLLQGGGGIAFAVSPADPDRILFSDSTPYGDAAGDLRLSTDGGRTFRAIQGPWRGSGAVVGRISIAFAPSSPAVVWASVAPPTAGSDGGRAGVYRSPDGGATFQAVFPSSQAGTDWYTNALAVSPTDPNLVYCGGVDLYRGRPGAALSQISSFYSQGRLSFVHGDQHGLVIDPRHPNTIYAATDGGLFVSTNGGKDWSAQNEGLGNIQFYAGAAPPTASLTGLIGGTQDNGTLMPSSGSVWSEVNGGDGFQCAVDPQRPSVLYASYVGSTYFISADGGQTFQHLQALPFLDQEAKPFRSPLTLDPANGARVFVGAQRVYRGDSDRTSSVVWTPLSAGALFPDEPIFRIAVAPGHGNVLYASAGAHLARTTAGGEPWTEIDPPGGQFITGIAVNPSDPDDVICARSGFTGQQVVRSRNGGATWSDLTADLPNVPADNLLLRPLGARLDAFLATDTGIYYADLNADPISWAPVGLGLPNVVVDDVLLANGGTQLIAVTHGRGMWALDAASLQIASPAGGEAWGIGSRRTVSWQSTGLPGAVRVELSRGGNSWETLADTVPGTGSLSWVVTGPTGDGARVRVSSTLDGSYQATSGSFSIVDGFTVSGRVTLGSQPLEGVTVAAGGTSTQTTADGTYTLPGVSGNVNVVPAGIGYRFQPESLSFALAADQPGVNFMASLAPALATLAFPASVRGGRPLSGKLTLTSPGNTNVVVPVSSDSPSVLPPKNGVKVPRGKTEFSFRIKTRRVGAPTPATITGVLGGAVVQARVTLLPQ